MRFSGVNRDVYVNRLIAGPYNVIIPPVGKKQMTQKQAEMRLQMTSGL